MVLAKYVYNMKLDDIIAYRTAKTLRKEVFLLAKKFPPDERFDLRSQILRSSRSVTANIAEGFGRFSKKDSIRFLHIARGSAFETLDHLECGFECGYFSEEEFNAVKGLNVEVNKLITSFLISLQRSEKKGKNPL
jgi:four helix bundle protein